MKKEVQGMEFLSLFRNLSGGWVEGIYERASKGLPGDSDGKESACNAGDSLVPASGRFAGEGNGNPLQCSCLENPRDGGAWWAAVYGVAQSRT